MNRDVINLMIDIIQTEKAAIEAYQNIVEDNGSDSTLNELRSILIDHQNTERAFREELEQFGEPAPEGSGSWGLWNKLLTGFSSYVGNNSRLKALKEGEEHGIKLFEKLANNKMTDDYLKESLRHRYIPQHKQHIKILDRNINQAAAA